MTATSVGMLAVGLVAAWEAWRQGPGRSAASSARGAALITLAFVLWTLDRREPLDLALRGAAILIMVSVTLTHLRRRVETIPLERE